MDHRDEMRRLITLVENTLNTGTRPIGEKDAQAGYDEGQGHNAAQWLFNHMKSQHFYVLDSTDQSATIVANGDGTFTALFFLSGSNDMDSSDIQSQGLENHPMGREGNYYLKLADVPASERRGLTVFGTGYGDNTVNRITPYLNKIKNYFTSHGAHADITGLKAGSAASKKAYRRGIWPTYEFVFGIPHGVEFDAEQGFVKQPGKAD